jgi:hypothetical protein
VGLKDKLLNILLYPPKLISGLSDKRPALYAGMLFIGAVDLFLPDFMDMYKLLFTGMPAASVRWNMLAAVGVVVVLGVVDTVFFSVPLYDLFKWLKKKEDQPHNASPVKLIKVYIMSHFIIVPINVLMHYSLFRGVTENSGALIRNLYVVYFFLILIWSSAIVTRGVNTLFNFNPIFRRLTFIIVFTWNFLLGMVFELQILNWLLRLFRQV